jgi:hypothetical protein
MSLWPTDRPLNGFEHGPAVALNQNNDRAAEPDVRRLVRPEDDQVVEGGALPAAARLTPYERLCRTGDQQLEQYDDVQAAIRSYKKALQLASADQRSIAPDSDTWLLMALKQSIN